MTILPEENLSQDITKFASECKKMINSDIVDFDVTIRVRNKVYYAHRFILNVRSIYFAAKLENTSELDLDEVPEHIEMLLRYCYTGEIDLTIKIAPDLYLLSRKYGFIDLSEEILNSSMSDWTSSQVFDVFMEETDVKSETYLRMRAYIENDFETFLMYVRLCPKMVSKDLWMNILSSWDINCEEEDIVKAIGGWADVVGLESLDEILPLVKWGLIPSKELGKGGKYEHLVEGRKNLIFTDLKPRSTQNQPVVVNRDAFVVTKSGYSTIFEKIGKDDWGNCLVASKNPLVTGNFIEWTLVSLNKNDHSGIVVGLTKDPDGNKFNKCNGMGVGGVAYNIPFKAKGCNEGDRIGMWVKNGTAIFYKNDVEMGKVTLESGGRYFGVCYIYYQFDKVKWTCSTKK